MKNECKDKMSICFCEKSKDQSLSKSGKSQIVKSIFVLLLIFLLILLAKFYGHKINLPEINSKASLSMILLFGLISGIHCVGMCGVFLVGACARDSETIDSAKNFRSNILYAIGKTISYTLIGGILGFFGQLFTITPFISAMTIVCAGVFLILYGLYILDVFSFEKFLKIKFSKYFAILLNKKTEKRKSHFLIGLFSGLLFGCGPLQIMYMLATVSGNAIDGAVILFVFGIGTLPALMSFGICTKMLSRIVTLRFIKTSGVLLIVMGAMMFNKGFLQAKAIDSSQADLQVSTPKCHGSHK